MQKPKTSTQRHAIMCERRKKARLKLVRNFWCHPDDEASIRAIAAACKLTLEAMERAKA